MPQKSKQQKKKSKNVQTFERSVSHKAPMGRAITTLAIRPPPIPRNTAHAERVCGLNDPFCPAARGARYSDSANVMSLAYTVHSRQTVTSLAGGNGGACLFPSFTYTPVVTALSAIGNVVTWNNFSGLPPIANVAQCRLVSGGAIIRCVAPYMTAAGMVHIRTFTIPTTASINTLDLGTYNCSHALDVALVDCKEVAITLLRSDPIKSKQFTAPGSINSGVGILVATPPGFEWVTISLDGCPASTACFEIEWIMNWEITFDSTTAVALLAQPSIREDATISTASDVVSSNMKSLFLGGVKAAGKHVLQVATTALADVIGRRFGIPKASSLLIKNVD